MSFNPELCRNESEVESKLIVQYLLPQLGYTPDTWHQEVAMGSIRLDFLAFAAQVVPFVLDANSPLSVVMEAKHPKQNLNNHVLRLRHYLTSLNVRYGLLTNGKEIRVYQKLHDEIQLVLQCSGKEVEAKIEEIRDLIGRDSLRDRQVVNYQKIETNLDKIGEFNCKKTLQDRQILDRVEMPISKNNLSLEIKKVHSMKTIAVYHNKGGVGKTTTVVNLAAAIRKKGKRVLVIDLDSQANTTFATGLVKFDDEEFDDIKDSNIRHILQSGDFYPIEEVARKSQFTNPDISVVPSHISLMNYENDLVQQEDSKMMLSEKLDGIEKEYDVVLIDTPPSLNLYARIALISADYLIIPSDLKPFANQGLINVDSFIKKINSFRKQMRKPPIEILGVLACKISTNNQFVKHTLPKRLEAIPNRYGFEVMDTVIYDRDDLAKCAERFIIVGDMEVADPISVIDFKPDSTAAQEFELLAIEVLQKIGLA